jgi:hypothetical protein
MLFGNSWLVLLAVISNSEDLVFAAGDGETVGDSEGDEVGDGDSVGVGIAEGLSVGMDVLVANAGFVAGVIAGDGEAEIVGMVSMVGDDGVHASMPTTRPIVTRNRLKLAICLCFIFVSP